MRVLFILLLSLLNCLSVKSQFNPDRYKSDVFPGVTETTNVLFSTNVPQPNPGGGIYEGVTGYPLNVNEYQTTNVNLYMNIFQPTGDTTTKRPVVIVCFGGGFVAGSKDHWSMRLIAQELAKRGFVTAVIDYRLGMNMFDAELSKRAVYRGVQDGRSAVRFFRADAAGANNYKIDPEQIFIGGHSAGAFIALHNAYLNKETERPASTYTWLQSCGFLGWSNCVCPNLGCLDCAGNNQSFSGHANAVFSLAGAVGSISYLETANDPRVVLFHSENDGTVPYTSGEPFEDISWLVFGSDLPVVYGSQPIHAQANSLGLPSQFFSYADRGHDVHEATSSTLYNDIIPGISVWFYNQRLKPSPAILEGNTLACVSEPFHTYRAENSNAFYFHWSVIGGVIQPHVNTSHTVSVAWDNSAPTHSITVTPYSRQWAAGNPVMLEVQLTDSAVNIWLGNNESWINKDNWSLLHIPQSCHHVIIPGGTGIAEPMIPAEVLSSIKSIDLGQNRTLEIQPGSSLIIRE